MINLQKTPLLTELKPLTEIVKIYVPSTFEVDKEIDNTNFVNEIASQLSDMFGGCTITDGFGCWNSNKGLVQEKVNIVYAYAEHIDNVAIDKILHLCNWLKFEMKQEAVSLELNNKLYFV